MTLRRYSATWWSSVDWGRHDIELLALNPEQVRTYVNGQTEPQYRTKGERIDTLAITDDGPVELPYLLETHA